MELQGSFDTWTALFLVVSAVGTFLSILLFTDKKGRRLNWPIALIILGFSLILVQYVFFWTGYDKEYPYFHLYAQSWYLIFGPLLYLYTIGFYHKDFKISFLHFLPAILSFVLAAYYLVITNGYTNVEPYQDQLLYKLQYTFRSSWLATLSFLIYLWIIHDTIKLLDTAKANTEASRVRNKWIKFLTRLFAVFALAYTSYFVLVNFAFFNSAWDYAISIVMSIGIYGIGYMVYTEPRIFNGELLTNLFLPKKDKENRLSKETKEEFYTTLKDHLSSEKSYRNNELRLVHMADKLGFSTHLLSQIINEKAGKNFNQFINEYRLEEAEDLLESSEISTVSNLYYDVGFNSKATFYNLFKKKHKCTPTEYRNLKRKG